jgi:hypothetical protein
MSQGTMSRWFGHSFVLQAAGKALRRLAVRV